MSIQPSPPYLERVPSRNLALYTRHWERYRLTTDIRIEHLVQAQADLQAEVCPACRDATNQQDDADRWDCCVIFVDDGWQYLAELPDVETSPTRVGGTDDQLYLPPEGIRLERNGAVLRAACRSKGCSHRGWRCPEDFTGFAPSTRVKLAEHVDEHEWPTEAFRQRSRFRFEDYQSRKRSIASLRAALASTPVDGVVYTDAQAWSWAPVVHAKQLADERLEVWIYELEGDYSTHIFDSPEDLVDSLRHEGSEFRWSADPNALEED